MEETLLIKFDGKNYKLTYAAFFRRNYHDFFVLFNNEPDLLKFAPAQFELTYSLNQYPNWGFKPSFGNRFDDLRVVIILALMDKFPDMYIPE